MSTLHLNHQYIGNRGNPLPSPHYATKGAAGLDLASDIDCTLPVLQHAIIPTGYAYEIPPGYQGEIRGRSGLASKGIFAHVGTIDSDYRGEVMVILYNLGDAVLKIKRGDRVAQMVIGPVVQVELRIVDSLGETSRGSNGLGSTGR